jgi:N-carbamoyl-L-amino-acid hydrolase
VNTALSPAIDGARLWGTLMAMAEVGATPEGGCDRVALTEADRAGQDLFAGWARDAGCRVTRDQIGNLYVERAGSDRSRSQILVGSHLDTQPNGGRFDGAYGVLAGLEIVRTLNDHEIDTPAPVVVVSWVNEEGARFPHATTGSAVFSGELSLDEALSQRAVDGASFGEELRRLDLAGDEDVGTRPVGAYFETHIEQGIELESAGASIGIVMRGRGVRALRVTLTGSASHAGTTSMDERVDALVAAARVVEYVNELGKESAGALATVGELNVEPNSRSVVPSRVSLVVDLRHAELGPLEGLEALARAGIERIAAASNIGVELSTFLRIDPTAFDESCNGTIARAALELGHRSLELVSGAAHDAMRLARLVPTALVFIPCRKGISHNPAEYASPEHVRFGCEVLLRAVLERAGALDPPATRAQ